MPATRHAGRNVLRPSISRHCLLTIQVKPRAAQDRVVGWLPDGVLGLRVTAAPVDGAANRRIVALLADALDVRKRDVEIVAGDTASIKRIRVTGRSLDEVMAMIRTAVPVEL